MYLPQHHGKNGAPDHFEPNLVDKANDLVF
jgi:hypothetical protein